MAAPKPEQRRAMLRDLALFQDRLPKLAEAADGDSGATVQTVYFALAQLPDIGNRVVALRPGDTDGYAILKERLDSLRQPLGEIARSRTLGETGSLASLDPRQIYGSERRRRRRHLENRDLRRRPRHRPHRARCGGAPRLPR